MPLFSQIAQSDNDSVHPGEASASSDNLEQIAPDASATYRGVKRYNSFRAGALNYDAWTYNDIAMYAPPGAVNTSQANRWLNWYDQVDKLYKKVVLGTGRSINEFNGSYRANTPDLGRKKVIGFPPDSCGAGCGNKQQAEAPRLERRLVQNPTDYVDHWIIFYEMGRGGSPERFYGRAMWPTNTVILPHTMAGMAFYAIGGDAGVERGTPGSLLQSLGRWERSNNKWIEHFVAADKQSVDGFNSHDLIAAMLYRILQDTDNIDTIVAILNNMANKPQPSSAKQAMCDFQRSINDATGNRFVTKLVFTWGMPRCGWTVPAPTPTPTPIPLFYGPDTIAYDGFGASSNGTLQNAGGGTGWAGNWSVTKNSAAAKHTAGNITYSGLPVAGNRLNVIHQTEAQNAFLAVRNLATPIIAGDVWLSVRVRANKVGSGHVFIGTTSSGDSAIGKAWGDTFSIHNDKSEVKILPDQPYLLVAKYVLNPSSEDKIYMWVNPDVTTEPKIADAAISKTAEIGKIDRLTLNFSDYGLGNYLIDEVRFGYPVAGTTPPSAATPTPPAPSNTTPLALDSFQGTANSALTNAGGGFGWSGNWQVNNNPAAARIAPDSLNYSVLNASGNVLGIKHTTESGNRLYATRYLQAPINRGDVWMAYRVRASIIGNGHIFVSTTDTLDSAVGKAWGDKFSIHNVKTTQTVEPNQTYLIVAKYSLNPSGTDKVQMWVNPDLSREPSSANAVQTTTSEIGSIDRISLNFQDYGLGNYWFDEIRFGKNWAQLIGTGTTPPPTPTPTPTATPVPSTPVPSTPVPSTPVPSTPTPTPTYMLGDVNCSNVLDPVDALFVIQYMVGLRTDYGSCPLADTTTQLNATVGDVDGITDINVVDALFILQCTVGIDNGFCPSGGIEAGMIDITRTDAELVGPVTMDAMAKNGTVHLTASEPIAAGTFELAYGSTDVSFSGCDSEGAAIVVCNEIDAGLVNVVYVNPQGDGNGQLAVISFDVPADKTVNVNRLNVVELLGSQGNAVLVAEMASQQNLLFLPISSR